MPDLQRALRFVAHPHPFYLLGPCATCRTRGLPTCTMECIEARRTTADQWERLPRALTFIAHFQALSPNSKVRFRALLRNIHGEVHHSHIELETWRALDRLLDLL